jgi:UDP-N-acetylmuramoyl-L-alanyl-D-glutamate--2,6-diaminopimelate ligase
MNTTPDALVLQTLFHDYTKAGIQQVAMEVSSHALAQSRVAHIPFEQAIFTNLTHDHLDYHQTMAAYASAKALLFATPSLRVAIINQDDDYANAMREKTPAGCQVLTYGIHDNADVQAASWEVNLQGTTIALKSPWGKHTLRIQALGFFNLYNALAIFTSLMAAGYSSEAVVSVMAQLKPAPGRMEVVNTEPTVIVDYAHTPDALENVLVTLNKVKTGRMIVVFGCGGDRDKLKRPIMGKIARDNAELVFLTSDNPRHEDPEQILADIQAGVGTGSGIECIVDREKAIARALATAEKEDIVVIAGKGHEAYQQTGDVRVAFSDQAVVRKLMGVSA